MNIKLIKITLVVVLGFAVLNWLRSDGLYDFNLWEIIPFMSRPTPHDWGKLGLILLGLWGWSRLRDAHDPDSASSTSDDYYEEYEEEDDGQDIYDRNQS